MKITTQNINEEWDNIKGKLSDSLQKMAVENGFLESAENYEDLKDFFDDEAKDLLNKFIVRINKELEEYKAEEEKPKEKPKEEEKPKPEEKPEEKPKEKKEKKPKEKKEKKPKEKKEKKTKKKEEDDFEVNYVEKVALERTFIARYLALVNSTQSKSALLEKYRLLLNRLQKSIIMKEVRKSSTFYEQLNEIQNELVNAINNDKKLPMLDADKKVEWQKIAKGEKVSSIVKIVKNLIKFNARKPSKDEAKKLLNLINAEIEKGNSDNEDLKDAKKSMSDYIDEKTSSVQTSFRSLRGLKGLCGIADDADVVDEEQTFENGGVITANELSNRRFRVLNFKGRWREFFGCPSENFKMMVYGSAGNGKSTFSLIFAKYLAESLNLKVLYVASEEKFGYTLKQKLNRFDIDSYNFYVSENLNVNLNNFDVVIIDSINELNLKSSDLSKFANDKAFIWIVQCTKDGHYKGDQGLAHDCDVVVNVENMKAYTEKNRFQRSGLIFEIE